MDGWTRKSVNCTDGRVLYAFIHRSKDSEEQWSGVQLHKPRKFEGMHPELFRGNPIFVMDKPLLECFGAAGCRSKVWRSKAAADAVREARKRLIPARSVL